MAKLYSHEKSVLQVADCLPRKKPPYIRFIKVNFINI